MNQPFLAGSACCESECCKHYGRICVIRRANPVTVGAWLCSHIPHRGGITLSSQVYSQAEQAILARYVTNVHGNIYAIRNLPEEVIAVIFAYVSRSPHSFRTNLLRLVQEGDVPAANGDPQPAAGGVAEQRAAAFHERWVVGYGHSSVAEHAVAHVGVERISRLASAELELASPFLSFTEYSQRYQKPLRGDYYLPPELPRQLVAQYNAAMHALYDAYEALYQGLAAYLEQTLPRQVGESATARQSRIAKVAFEDARYALPLATCTNLGLTGNGRALRDCIAHLKAAVLPESVAMAQSLADEVGKIIPTLLRHASPSPYQEQLRLAPAPIPTNQPLLRGSQVGPETRLLAYTGQGAPDPEMAALEVLAGAYAAAAVGSVDIADYLTHTVDALGPHDMLPEAFRWVRYDCSLTISEASWHQLLRHVRGMSFQWGPPEPVNGYTVPPNISAAGLASTLAAAVQTAEELYDTLMQSAPALAGYAVTNAHRRRIRTTFDLVQLYHLVNLRVSEHAQWDIRDAVTQLWNQVRKVHPRLAARAGRR